MKRYLFLAYGVTCYALTLAVLVYAVGFMSNLVVPKSIDGQPTAPLGAALLVNGLLLAVFALQHSIMARPAFKRWWSRFVPKPIERTTYCLYSNLALVLLFWQWQPMGGVVWDIQSSLGRGLLYGVFAAGWITVLVTTFLINHFELFGLSQVWHFFRGSEPKPIQFVTPGPYRFTRHPLYVGWILAIWATPTMSIAHLVFAAVTTLYIIVAIQFEERDLQAFHGEEYADYKRRTSMLIPLPPRRTSQDASLPIV